jgi:shikimate kinase
MKRLELLTKEEFVAHYIVHTLRLVFVGMSNTGKSRRAKTLRDALGFSMYSVDGLIARALGFTDVHEVGTWMKGPASYGYRTRERRYLELEAEHTFLESVWDDEINPMNFVFDTTGSVAHLPEWIRQWLSDNALVVYLTVEESDINDMIKRFFNVPKPVVWEKFWKKHSNRSNRKTTRHAYPRLLAYRAQRYADMANISIPAKKLYDKSQKDSLDAPNKNAIAILDTIMSRLPGPEPVDVPWRQTA